MLHIQLSVVCAAPPPLPISVLIQGRGGLTPPPSSVRTHAPLLPALIHKQVEPPLQPSAVNHLPLSQRLAFTLQRDVPPIQPLSPCDPHTPISVLLQGRIKPPLLSLTVCAYVHIIYALLPCQCVPLCQPSAKPYPLPQLSALPLQGGVPPLWPLSMRARPPPTIFVSLQGIGVPPLLP